MVTFIDTSAFLALVNKKDQFHQSAKGFLTSNPRVITSSWVIEEFIAHLHARYGLTVAKKGVSYLQNAPHLTVEFVSSVRLKRTFDLFLQKGSRAVSIVDVSNVIIMNELGVSRIFAFDRSFSSVFGLTVAPNA